MTASSIFANPSVPGVLLALAFGGTWLAILAPLYWRKSVAWTIFIAGAALFVPAIVWVQAPLQREIGLGEVSAFGPVYVQTHALLMAVPVVLITGIVQEGAKFLPAFFYWLLHGEQIDLKVGLSLGAVAGAGFGIIEAQWVLNSIFAGGWSPDLFQLYGITAYAGFWERFFTVGFHIALGALSGYGLAKGRGWQFYLLAAFFHFAANYLTVFYARHVFTVLQFEGIIALIAAGLFAWVVFLRRRHYREPGQ